MRNHEKIIAALRALDVVLQKQGFPAMSPWWSETIERCIRRDVRRWVLRVGRRGGKSSTLCRLAVALALFADWNIPPGDIGYVAFVSVSRDEAAARLRTIRAILTALGERFVERGDTIELVGRRIGFKVLTCSVAGVSGFTCIAAIGDEVSKWKDSDTGANPAAEVIGATVPTLATTGGIFILSSSPLTTTDAHAEAFDLGETENQAVAFAPTWTANPTIAEDETHALEPDHRRWLREFAGVPQTGVLGAFDEDKARHTFRQWDNGIPRSRVLVIDASSGRKDSWTWGVCGWVGNTLRFTLLDGLTGGFWQQVSGAEIVARLAGLAKRNSVSGVYGDQRESMMLSSEFQKHGLYFRAFDWTAQSKPLAVERVRRWMREDALSLPEHEIMLREMLRFEERITPSGAFTFGARGTGHDDYVALLLTAAMADAAGVLRPAVTTSGAAVYTRDFDRGGLGFEAHREIGSAGPESAADDLIKRLERASYGA